MSGFYSNLLDPNNLRDDMIHWALSLDRMISPGWSSCPINDNLFSTFYESHENPWRGWMRGGGGYPKRGSPSCLPVF